MQFELITDLDRALPAVIEFNYEQLKEELSKGLEKYHSLVVTEDTIQDGKKRRADLNKLATAIDDQRKAVKSACLAPYENFEAKCKVLIGMVKEAILSIDTQVKSFEDDKRAEKREAIEGIYSDKIGNLAQLLPFDRLWSDKWLNAGEKLPAIEKAIADAITKFRNDLGIIKAMRLEFEQQVLDVYIRTLDMSAALAEKARLEEQAEQLKKLETLRQVEREEPPKTEVTDISVSHPVRCPEAGIAAPDVPKTIRIVFYDTTAAFRAEMKALTQKHNIRYGSVK